MELSINGDVPKDGIESWVAKTMPGMTLEAAQDGHLRYQVDTPDFQLSAAFETMQKSHQSLGIANFSISQTTLEQVAALARPCTLLYLLLYCHRTAVSLLLSRMPTRLLSPWYSIPDFKSPYYTNSSLGSSL
jgi:hypothetical protein